MCVQSMCIVPRYVHSVCVQREHVNRVRSFPSPDALQHNVRKRLHFAGRACGHVGMWVAGSSSCMPR